MISGFRFDRSIAQVFVVISLLTLAACNSSEERAESHYKRGLEFTNSGELVKANLEFRNALKLKSDHVDALYSLGEVTERQGNLPTAFKIYVSVAEQAPNNLPVRLKLVYLLLAANQLEEAEDYLTQASSLDENAVEVLVAKASYELRVGNLAEVESFAKQALSADKENTEALAVLASAKMKAGDPEGALSYLDQVPESSETDIGLQILRLSVLESMGDQAAVEDLFAKLVQLNPERREFNEAWARWYLSKQRHDDAERVLRNYAAANPDVDAAQFGLVSFLGSLHGPDEAINELRRIIRSRDEASSGSFSLQLALAQMMFSANQQTEAIKLMQTLVAETDDQGSRNAARNLLGSMFAQTAQWDLAENQLDEVLGGDPKNVEALRLRASLKMQEKNFEGAVDDILSALNEAPENARLRAMLAGAYERQGASVLAEEQYGKALTLDNNAAATGLPLVQFLMRHGKAEKAHRVLEQVRDREPTNKQVLELLAQFKLATQDWAGAQKIADDLRRLDETDNATSADQISAAALGGLNKHAESLKVLEGTMNTAGGRQAALPALIRAYIQTGKQDAAIEYLNSILAEEKQNSLAQVMLASVYLSMGQNEKAKEQLVHAASNDEGLFAQTSLAQFYIASRDFESAEQTIRTGLEKDGNSTALRLMLTSVLQQDGRFEEAIAEYEKMFERNPESTIVANDLASLLSERRGDEESLDRAFEIAQRFRNSEIPQYLDTLGWIYYLRGDYPSALPLLRTAAQKLPNIGLVQYHLGMVLAAARQNEQALVALENALTIGTSMTDADIERAHEQIQSLKTQ